MMVEILGINFLFNVWSIVFFFVFFLINLVVALMCMKAHKKGENVTKMQKLQRSVRLISQGILFITIAIGLIGGVFTSDLRWLTFALEPWLVLLLMRMIFSYDLRQVAKRAHVIAFAIGYIVVIMVGAGVRYLENVITLEPEVKTNIYFMEQDVSTLESTTLSENILEDSDYSVTHDYYNKVVLVSGLTRDYVEETIVYNYQEDRNVEPYKRTIKSVHVTYTLYLNEEKYNERIDAK